MFLLRKCLQLSSDIPIELKVDFIVVDFPLLLMFLRIRLCHSKTKQWVICFRNFNGHDTAKIIDRNEKA
jgi:hypothetical protein